MANTHLSIEQKAAGKDLNIIIAITLVTLTLLLVFNSQIMAFAQSPDESLLLRTSQWPCFSLALLV